MARHGGKGRTAVFVFKHPFTGEDVSVEGRGKRIARARALIKMNLVPAEFDLVPEEPVRKYGECSSGKLNEPRKPFGRLVTTEPETIDVSLPLNWGRFV